MQTEQPRYSRSRKVATATKCGFSADLHNVSANSAQFFSLVIDTSRVPLHLAARWIMEAAKEIDRQSIPPERNSLNAEVDPVLLKTVREVLKIQD